MGLVTWKASGNCRRRAATRSFATSGRVEECATPTSASSTSVSHARGACDGGGLLIDAIATSRVDLVLNFHEDRSQTAEALLLYRSRVLNLLWPYVTCWQWENPKSRNFAGLAGFWSLHCPYHRENVPTVATASIAGCGTVHHEHEHRSNPGRQFERGHQIVPKLACTLARTTPKSVSRR